MRPWLRVVSSLKRNTFPIVTPSSGKVLVNCQMGMSRSSTCVLAYLILRHQMSADEALNTVSNGIFLQSLFIQMPLHPPLFGSKFNDDNGFGLEIFIADPSCSEYRLCPVSS